MDYYGNANGSNKSKLKKVVIFLSIAMVLLTTITIIVCVVCFDIEAKDYKHITLKGAVDMYFESIETGNFKEYIALVPPYWKDRWASIYEHDEEIYFKESISHYDCDIGNRLTYKITECEYLEKSDLELIRENCEFRYGDEYEIQKYAIVDIKVKGSDGTEWKYTDFEFIKIDGKWYHVLGDLD